MKKSMTIVGIAALFLVLLWSRGLTTPVTFSDDYLLSDDFVYEWGPAGLARSDYSGPGVLFSFTGLTASGTGVGDNFEVAPGAGGAGAHNADFTAYDSFALSFTNLDADPVWVTMFMNTGFTDPPRSGAYDTYFQGPWIHIGGGETTVVALDFANAAEIYNAGDDPNPAWQFPNGAYNGSIFRLDEVSNIGFQVADFSGNNPGAEIVAARVPEPTTIMLLGSGLIGLGLFGRKRFRKK